MSDEKYPYVFPFDLFPLAAANPNAVPGVRIIYPGECPELVRLVTGATDLRSPRAMRRWKKRQAEKQRKQYAEFKAAYKAEVRRRDLEAREAIENNKRVFEFEDRHNSHV